MRILSPSREVLPIWKQFGIVALIAVACVLAAAFIVLAFVAFSAAWGPVK